MTPNLKTIVPLIFLIAMFGIPTIGRTQTLTIEQAIDMALKNNLQLKSQTQSIQSTQELRKTAFELPKTDVNFRYGQTNSFSNDNEIQISQTIPFPTLFGAKRKLVDEQVKGQQWIRATNENEIIRQVRWFYYQLSYLQHNAYILNSLDSIYADFIRVAELRYQTGDVAKIDVQTARTKKGEIYLMWMQNENERENTYRTLQNVMQTAADFKIEEATKFQPLLLSSIVDTANLQQHPSVQQLYQEAKIAEQTKKVEKANGLPDFTIGYDNISLIGMHSKNGVERFYDRGTRFSAITVGIAIPLTYGATKARIRSLESQKQSLELSAKWQTQLLKTNLQNSLNQYKQFIAQYNFFIDQALPNGNEIINAAKIGYNTGELSYVEYLYALQTVSDIRLDYLMSIQRVNEAVITISSIIIK